MNIKLKKENRNVNCAIWNNSQSNDVLIIAPGIAISGWHYRAMADYFFNKCYSVIIFDYFGMIHSKKTSLINTIKLCDWGRKDINMVIAYALKEFPGQKLFFLGHSIAGQLFPLAKNSSKVTAAFLVASQNLSQRNWSGLPKLKVYLLWHLIIPFFVNFLGYLPGMAYGGKYDLHKSIATDWAKWGKSKLGLLSVVKDAKLKYKNLDVPVKFLSFSDDAQLAPLKAVEHLYDSYGSTRKSHEHICPKEVGLEAIGHFNFFKKDYSKLWTKIDSWFDQVNYPQ